VDPLKKAKGRKIVYGGSHRWTNRSHPYRRNLLFDGKIYFRATPSRMSAIERRCGDEHDSYIASRGKKGGDDDPMHDHEVKCRNASNDLPYWMVSFLHLCKSVV